MDYLDISLIRDARTGKYAKVPKVSNQIYFTTAEQELIGYYLHMNEVSK